MNTHNMAFQYMADAEYRLASAHRAQMDGAHHIAVRWCQETVELALKAALRFLNLDPPKLHEPTGIMDKHRERFPSWFSEQIDEWMATSRKLDRVRSKSMYGDEKLDLPPTELFDETDSAAALSQASRVVAACRRLIDEGRGPLEETPSEE